MLGRAFPQLRFPIREGLSADESYRAATRRGVEPSAAEGATGLGLARPERVRLEVHRSAAGRIPMIVAGERGDFERLVQALACRNEPQPVPPSMGACLVRGLNDWGRVRAFRVAWERENPAGSWSEEGLPALAPRKDLYQDRFVVLSSGPYSGVGAEEAGMGDEEWLARSLEIRREHEATHYLALRVTGIVRDSLVDELVADWVGLVATFGSYRHDLALRFLGLEAFPAYREGGRLQNYLGSAPLSEAATALARRLAHAAAGSLARLPVPGGRPGSVDRLALRLLSFSLEELAAGDLEGGAEEP